MEGCGVNRVWVALQFCSRVSGGIRSNSALSEFQTFSESLGIGVTIFHPKSCPAFTGIDNWEHGPDYLKVLRRVNIVVSNLQSVVGIDASEKFKDICHSSSAKELRESMCIGVLKK